MGEKSREQETENLEQELFVRKIPEGYTELIAEVDLVKAPDADYSKSLCKELENEKYGKLLAEKIMDGVVLDLGCGQIHWPEALAKKNNAKRYIGVDLEPISGAVKGNFEPNDGWASVDEVVAEGLKPLEENLELPSKNQIKIVSEYFDQETKSQSIIIYGDMLDVIARLEDNSISAIIVSGIEGADTGVNTKYLSALSEEIKRILKKDGILIKYVSDIDSRGLKEVVKIGKKDGAIYEEEK